MQDVVVLHLTDEIVAATINIRKHYKTKLPDAIIAATAMVHGLTLLTRNTIDFNSIEGIQVIDPHKM